MPIPTVSLDETSPPGNQAISLGDNRIKEFKTQVREIVGVDHKYESSGQHDDMGKHRKCTFIESADIGTGVPNFGILGVQTVSTRAELVFTNENDADIVLTYKTGIAGDSVLLSNNVYLKAENAAGSGTVNLIKANASDKPVLPDGAELATNAAPTTDVQIANKKYVDDSAFSPTAGMIIKTDYAQTGALFTINSNIPIDDTIPQNTEGVEVLSKAYTPTSATNILRIDVIVQIYLDGVNTTGSIALFMDSVANALAAGNATGGSTGGNLGPSTSAKLTYFMVAGTTSAITFKVRAGASNTSYVNGGGSATRIFGGVSATSITISEIVA